jgi:hypothetical protein
MTRQRINRLLFHLGVLAPLLITIGCSSARVISTADDVARINVRAEKHTAQVKLFGTRTAPARSLRIDADSASWLDPQTGELHNVPIEHLEWIQLPPANRLEGALLGMALSAGVGIVGTYVGTALLQSSCSAPVCRDHNEVFLDAVIPLTLINAAGGLALGTMMESRYRLRLLEQAHLSHRSGQTTGHAGSER